MSGVGRISLLKRAYGVLPSPLRGLARAARQRVPFPWRIGLRFGRHHQRFWQSQWLSAAELEQHQLNALRRVVRHASTTVPAYRAIFRELGISHKDIRSFEDFAALPLTTKIQLQEEPKAYLSDAVGERQRMYHTTSGSTGTPLRVVTTNDTWAAERAVMYRGWRWAGYELDDRIVTAVGPLRRVTSGDVAPVDRFRDHLDLSPHHLDDAGCRGYVEVLRDFAPCFIRTYPSVLQILGQHLQEQRVKLPTMKALLTHSEVVYPAERKLLQEMWNAPLYDFYGMQEKCVAMSECEHQSMHVNAEFGLVELLPSDYDPYCRVVATGFFNDAMPLLRYATGDMALSGREPCPCGRHLPTLERLVGRVDDFIFGSDGSHVIELDAAIADLQHIRECQIIQETLHRIVVLLVPAPAYSAADEQALKRTLHQQLGEDVEVTVERRDCLERTSSGKLRFIVGKLKPGWRL